MILITHYYSFLFCHTHQQLADFFFCQTKTPKQMINALTYDLSFPTCVTKTNFTSRPSYGTSVIGMDALI